MNIVADHVDHCMETVLTNNHARGSLCHKLKLFLQFYCHEGKSN